MKGEPIDKSTLHTLYVQRRLSAADIGQRLNCSTNKVHYWLARRGIARRGQSEATYAKRNPHGDPFSFSPFKIEKKSFLFGLGLGLYWGEGTKKSKTAIRLGNTDPKLIRKFIDFLVTTYGVERRKFRFGIQIFSDMKSMQALNFWSRSIKYPKSHFMKVIVTPARSIGTYREKTKHGVLTVYVSNKKLRDLLNQQIESL